MLNLSHSDLYL